MAELCIQAGLQDRVIQTYEGCMYMDFAQALLEERGYGEYARLPIEHLPLLWLAYLSDPSNSGKMHNDVKSRWLQGDEEVLAAMRQFGALTDRARAALDGKDWKGLAEAMSANFALRRRVYGEAALGEANLKMIAVAEEAGLPVKFPGSGGAVVGTCDAEKLASVRRAYEREGFVFVELEPHFSDDGDGVLAARVGEVEVV